MMTYQDSVESTRWLSIWVVFLQQHRAILSDELLDELLDELIGIHLMAERSIVLGRISGTTC